MSTHLPPAEEELSYVLSATEVTKLEVSYVSGMWVSCRMTLCMIAVYNVTGRAKDYSFCESPSCAQTDRHGYRYRHAYLEIESLRRCLSQAYALAGVWKLSPHSVCSGKLFLMDICWDGRSRQGICTAPKSLVKPLHIMWDRHAFKSCSN